MCRNLNTQKSQLALFRISKEQFQIGYNPNLVVYLNETTISVPNFKKSTLLPAITHLDLYKSAVLLKTEIMIITVLQLKVKKKNNFTIQEITGLVCRVCMSFITN